MVEQLVGLLVGGLAVVAGDLDGDVGGDQRAVQALDPVQDRLGDGDGVRAGALGDGERHRRHPLRRAVRQRDGRDERVAAFGGEADVGDVADIDRPVVAGGDQQVADLLGRAQRLAGDQRDLLAVVADPAGREGAVGAGDLGGELLQRHAVERQPLRIGRDADHLAGLADEVGQADVLDLGDLGAQLAGDAGQVVRR